MAADKISKNKIKNTKKITKKSLTSKKNTNKVIKKSKKPTNKKATINKTKLSSKVKVANKKSKPTTAKIKKLAKLHKKQFSVKKIAKPKSKTSIKPIEKTKKSSATIAKKPTYLEDLKLSETYAPIDNQYQQKKENLQDLTCSAAREVLQGPSKFEPYHIHSNEEYMNEQQLQHFASILEAWKQELMIEVDNTITEMKEADVLADLNDRATQEETFNLELRARDRERKLIKKIESALKKISNQEYGYCESCGVEIGVRRLEARPTATLCIECKTLAEIREKRT